MKTVYLLFLWLVTAQATHAQDTRILVPLTPDRVTGAHGSVWDTELAITNMNEAPTTVLGYFDSASCPVMCGTAPEPIPARSTLFLSAGVERCTTPGRLLQAVSKDVDMLAFTLRSRDTSRDERAWGAIVPVVREDGLYATRFSLVDVPVVPRFRAMLRIYDVDPITAAAISVRYYAVTPDVPPSAADVLLAEATPRFIVPPQPTSFCPAYAELPLSLDPRIAGAGRIRVEIQPLDGRRDYWAFVSVTNNDTQEVSIIAPN